LLCCCGGDGRKEVADTELGAAEREELAEEWREQGGGAEREVTGMPLGTGEGSLLFRETPER